LRLCIRRILGLVRAARNHSTTMWTTPQRQELDRLGSDANAPAVEMSGLQAVLENTLLCFSVSIAPHFKNSGCIACTP
jgi:hypothetical protein